jgi:hypothetical protein
MSPTQIRLHAEHLQRIPPMRALVPIERVRPPLQSKQAPLPKPVPVRVPIVVAPQPLAPAQPAKPSKAKPGFWFRILPDDLPPRMQLEKVEGAIRIIHVQRMVADYFELHREEMISERRSVHIALARQVGIYLCKVVLANKSLPEIGRRFNRDHTTVLHAVQKIERCARQDDLLGCAIRHLEAQLRAAIKARSAAMGAA